MAISFNGIGIVFHGKRQVEPDGSYVATKWIAFAYFPLFPLGSYRVWLVERKTVPFAVTTEKFRSRRVPIQWSQVIGTYIAAVLAVAFVIGVFWGAFTGWTFKVPRLFRS